MIQRLRFLLLFFIILAACQGEQSNAIVPTATAVSTSTPANRSETINTETASELPNSRSLPHKMNRQTF